MKIDINKLAEYFARTPFQVEGVYRGRFEPGVHIKDFTEPFPGFLFPLGGKAEVAFNDLPCIVCQESIAHGGARMNLSVRVLGPVQWEYLLVLYRLCAPEWEGLAFSDTAFELHIGQSLRINELVQRLWRISSQPGGIPAFQTETLFRDILAETFHCGRNQTANGSRALFEMTSSYIHEHYMDDLTIQMLAEHGGVNRNRLTYVFHKYAGMGPGDYLLRYRLNKAKELLLIDSLPVREIAQAAGFRDPFYFSRVFRRRIGISPSGFREGFINNPC